MNAYSFPVDLVEDGDTVMATFPGLEGATFGEDEADALLHASDLLESIIQGRMMDREDVPLPPPARGRPTVPLSAVIAAKVAIYRTMREAGVHKAELRAPLWLARHPGRSPSRHHPQLAHGPSGTRSRGPRQTHPNHRP